MPGGHAQTIYAAQLAPLPQIDYQRTVWDTPDGDQIAVDSVIANARPDAPTLILLHGLEGSSNGHYARSHAQRAVALGWTVRVIHWRGCGGLPNRAPRAYHSGDSAELDWMLARAAREADRRLAVVGISLGGNVLLKWLGERGDAAAAYVASAAAISVPYDLAVGAATLASGFGMVYSRHFLSTMKPKALAQLERYPDLFNRQHLIAARNLHDFDDVYTAPVHGFASADVYYQRSSSVHYLGGIRLPTLLVSARNDPFLPAHCLPASTRLSPAVRTLWTESGGHAGFCHGLPPGRLEWLPTVIIEFLQSHQ